VVHQVGDRTGAAPVVVPESTDGAPGVNTYFDLLNIWISSLAAAFSGRAS
jgi:hypothetical protein